MCARVLYNNIIIINGTFNNNTVNNYGGGLLIFFGINIHNNIAITNSTFENNTAPENGGGLLVHSDTDIHNNITITNSAFTNNTIFWYGGGVYMYSVTDIHNDIKITNSVFTSNTADGGGSGLLIDSVIGIHNNIIIINSTFTFNSAVDGGGLWIYSYSNSDYENITIVNSIFTNNKGSGLILNSAKHYEVKLSKVMILNNNHSGIIVLNHVTVVFTEGHSIVANNSSPTDGGGIYLGKDCYLTTSNGGNVSFINNTAYRYGGAIYSLDNDYYLFSTLKLYALLVDQCTVYDLSATFIDNSAVIAGDQLYGGVFVLCQDTVIYDDYLQHLLKCTNVPNTIENNVSSVHPLSPVSSHPLVVCPCVNGTIGCNVRSLHRQVYPGQILNVSMVTVGLCGGVSPGTIFVESQTTHYFDIKCYYWLYIYLLYYTLLYC